MKKLLTVVSLLFWTFSANGQYLFKDVVLLKATEIKDQANTGTCWSFATVSFIESELIRMGKEPIDLSEMFFVRQIYMEKASNYLLRQGKANFSQGALAHDQIRAMAKYGAIPESYYSGRLKGQKKHDHSKLEQEMKALLDGMIAQNAVAPDWKTQLNAMLDRHLGEMPKDFMYQGKLNTPMSFSQELGIDLSKYLTITSFSHHPYYRPFILEIPDNFSNGSYQNLPLDEFEQVIDHALAQGYSISWDCDVTEETFSASEGVAVWPEKADKSVFLKPVPEQTVTQEMRQQAFEQLATTDDHLMHLVGTATDQQGRKFYVVKNSWGEISAFKGYLYVSAAYLRMKSIAITLHQDALPASIAEKLGLKK